MTSLRGALWLLLRVYALLFELALSLFLLGLGIVALASNPNSLNLGMLPWEGSTLTRMVLILAVASLVSVLLAGTGLRWIFPVWCLFVAGMMVRGFFLGNYSFSGAKEFQFAIGLTFAAFIAFLGSLGVFRRRPARR